MKIRSIAWVAAAAITFITCVNPVQAEGDPIVATVNGTKILRSQVVEAYSNLPEQYRQVPMDQLYPVLVNSLIDSKLAADQARKEKIHESAEFKAELAAITDRLLGAKLIQERVDAKISDETVAKRYADMVKEIGEQVEVHARHILVKTEDEAKALATQMGMTWGGTGEYQVKGAYYYKEGQHEGTMWWGTGGDEDTISAPMSCVRFRPLYPRNDEDKFFYCRTEEEARVIAGKMGMAWGGTSGEDKVKGAYCYKEGEHKGKMWWGEGGAAAERYAPVTADRFRPLQQPKNDTEDDEFYCCWGAEFLGIYKLI